MPKYITLNVSPKAKTVIERLAQKYEMTLLDFTESMVIYFDKTGVNPKDIKVLSVAEELKKFRDTIISFLRTQEKEYILPTFGKMDALIVRFSKYIEEEAPKINEAGHKSKTIFELPGVKDGEPKHEQAELKLNVESLANEKYDKLKADYEKLELKYNTVRQYLENILNKTEYGSTGMGKGLIVKIPIGDINDYKAFIKRL